MRPQVKILLYGPMLLIMVAFSYILYISVNSSKEALIQTHYVKLSFIRDTKKEILKSFFEEKRRDLTMLALSKDLINWAGRLTVIERKATWTQEESAKKEMDVFFKKYIHTFGYENLYIISTADRKVVYTARRDKKSLSPQKVTGSELERVYGKVVQKKGIAFTDMQYVGQEKIVMYLGAPVYIKKDMAYIVVVSLDSRFVNEMMKKRDSLTQTGESYLVGKDHLMRSDSFLEPKGHALLASFLDPKGGSVHTEAVREAFLGKEDTKIIIDYNGNPVLSAYTAVAVDEDLTWALVSEIDEAEVLKSPKALRNEILIISGGVLLLLLGVIYQLLKRFRSLYIELSQLNRTLEERVEEKTQELNALNKELMAEVDQQVQDIRKKDKALLEQSRFAQMGEMISMIAHQWRQPLSAINTVLIETRVNQELEKFDLTTQEGRSAEKAFLSGQYQKVEALITYLSDTINDFRDFFKEDKEVTSLQIRDVVETALKILEGAFTTGTIRLEKEYREEGNFQTYKNELLQVIVNIVKNGIDVLQERKVSNATIWLRSYESEAGMHVLEIEDNGGGIEPELLDKIFEPYFSTKSYNGTGLGLYMSKMVIEKQCRGKVFVHTGEGRTLFKILLPPSLDRGVTPEAFSPSR